MPISPGNFWTFEPEQKYFFFKGLVSTGPMGILSTYIAAHNQALTFAFLTNIIYAYFIIYFRKD